MTTIDDVRELAASGLTRRAIAERVGRSLKRIHDICREKALKTVADYPPSKYSDRNALICELYGTIPSGVLAAKLGLTKNQVIGVANRAGLTKGAALPEPPPQLTDDDFRGCRWIEGDPKPLRPGMFCCSPRIEGSSYCVEHHARTFRASGGDGE